MKRFILQLSMVLMPLLFTGCLSPVKNEIALASSDLSLMPKGTNETKLVIFNNSNFAMYGVDGTGRINVKLDGKGVARLSIGQYLQVITTKGPHTVELVHRDVFRFRSRHTIELTEPESFLKIYATIVGNEVELVPRLPTDFVNQYRPHILPNAELPQ